VSTQPLVVGIGRRGSLVQTYCFVENLTVETPSLLSAVDKAFKIHFIAGLEYEQRCCHVWQLIQKAVYGIEDSTTTYAGVHDFINFIKRKKSSKD
jgi:hypothetical protein